jgi:TPR repeat protein
MGKFDAYEDLEEQFQRFERAAAKGHEESVWIGSVVKNVEMKKTALKEAFAKTEEPLGWYFAGRCSVRREAFDLYKKSAEGGCSWGQVRYGLYFNDENNFGNMYADWLEKAANQNNPRAMNDLGELFRHGGGDKVKAVSYYRAAADLGWKDSLNWLAFVLRHGIGCMEDLRQAAVWGAQGGSYVFWDLLERGRGALESKTTENLDCDFDQLCFSLGWGLYWYQYGSGKWNNQSDKKQVFGEKCLDYYCSCIDLQQKSIFTFLLCWNRTTGGVKGPGQMIGQMVWEGRDENLVISFQENDGEEPETKRIKK